MADVQTERITESAVLAFLKSERPTSRCKVCNADNLEPIMEPDQIHVAQVRLPASGASYFPAIGLVCVNCGDIALLAWPFVMKWADEHGDASDG